MVQRSPADLPRHSSLGQNRDVTQKAQESSVQSRLLSRPSTCQIHEPARFSTINTQELPDTAPSPAPSMASDTNEKTRYLPGYSNQKSHKKYSGRVPARTSG